MFKYEMSTFSKFFINFFKLLCIFLLLVFWILFFIDGDIDSDNKLDTFFIYLVMLFAHVLFIYIIFRIPISVYIGKEIIKFNLLFNYGKKYKKKEIINYDISKSISNYDRWLKIKVKNNFNLDLLYIYRIFVLHYKEEDYKNLKKEIIDIVEKK